jgi:hypothetical protein
MTTVKAAAAAPPLCCRCAKAPAAFMLRTHGVGLCADCYVLNLAVSVDTGQPAAV